ncbi:MAG TPA: hypothetical protein VD905_04285 [Flavobacteriales bacterium]|nr:hypothetical protein [Flavobacteriales bacterium]
MKLKSVLPLALLALAGCGGMSEEEKTTKINDAADMRAKQVCESGEYQQKLDYLTDQLKEDGITEQADVDKAIAAFDAKVKESCPDKHPDAPKDNMPVPEPGDTVSTDTTVTEE